MNRPRPPFAPIVLGLIALVAVPAVADVRQLAVVLQEMHVFDGNDRLARSALDRVAELAGGRVGVGIQEVTGIAGYAALQRNEGLKSDEDVVEQFVDELSAQMAMRGAVA